MTQELLQEVRSLKVSGHVSLANGAIIRANSTRGNGRTRRFFTVQESPTARPQQVRDAQEAVEKALAAGS